MHEQAVMRDIMSRVLEVADDACATSVSRIDVRLGALSHFTPEHFAEHFADAARGTLAEGARIHAVLAGGTTADVILESVELEVPD